MKTLQNNFTTPAQSKRLLGLGVPILTADCYYYVHEVNGKNICNTPLVIPFGMGEYGLKHWWADKYNDRYIPCWSVGRLIEICLKCSTLEKRQVRFFCNGDDDEYSLIDYVVTALESGVMTNHMDFSKLED